MNNTLIFLRHALTTIDLDIPSAEWDLSEQGKQEIQRIADSGVFDSIDILISSDEKKAIRTAEPIARRLNLKIRSNPLFRELDRKQIQSKDKTEYEIIVKQVFEKKAQSILGCETAENSLNRFKKGIKIIEESFVNSKILIVSHGIILTLFRSDYLKWSPRKSFSEWKKLRFCEWFVIE